MDFVQLHCHSTYSILDGLPNPEEYVEKAKQMEMSALALTDHGNMSGVLNFHNACKREGIKPITGCEFYINNRRDETIPKGEKNPNSHIVLLAKNKMGYKNLLKINYDSFVDGFYYRARTTTKFIFENSKGIVCLTACLGGEIPTLIIKGEERKAESLFLKYKEVFGEDFYGELMFNETSDQGKVTNTIYKFCKKHRVKFVITGDCHYLEEKDVKLQDILLMINQKKTISSKDKFSFTTRKLYFHSPEDYFTFNEKYKYALSKKAISEGIANTLEVADKCNLDSITISDKFPSFTDNYGVAVNANAILKNNAWTGLNHILKEHSTIYEKRLKRELDVIERRGYSDYFLIIEDIIVFCKENDIAIGAGRGSAAGSLVSYALGITKVDPIKHNLIFERFLNEVRKTIPDIDLDFESGKRDLIEAYVKQKYGLDKVAHIVAFNNFRVKGAIRDVAKVLEKDKDTDFNTLIKKFEGERLYRFVIDYPLMRQLEEIEWTAREKKYIKENKKLFDYANKLVGRIKYVGQHAAGVALTAGKLYEHIPVYKVKGDIVTGFIENPAVKELSQCGVLKIDILGLDQVTILKQAVIMTEKYTEDTINLDKIDLEDPKLFKSLNEEPSNGIFQLEGYGITSFLKKVKPTCFEDLVAINALYRPAVLDVKEHERYLRRRKKVADWERQHDKKYKYDTELGKILASTCGIIVYQEQFMMILNKLGDFTLEEADRARKVFELRKEHERKELNDMIKKFKSAAFRKGYGEKYIDKLVKRLITFASYSFNKSHSVSYSIVSMQSLYMRYYYPLYFYAALLNNTPNIKATKEKFYKENTLKKYIYYVDKKEIEFLDIDINKSDHKWNIEDGKIRMPMTLLNGVGASFVSAICDLRPFSSASDFFLKELKIRSNSTSVMSLINIGAFDRFGKTRRALSNFYSEWLLVRAKYKNNEEKALIKMKEMWKKYKKEEEYIFEDLKYLEKELIYFNFRYRIPEEMKDKIDWLIENNKIVGFEKATSTPKRFCVEIVSDRRHVDKNGNPMKFLSVVDHEGMKSEMIVFAKNYAIDYHTLEESHYRDNFYVVKAYSDNEKLIVVSKQDKEAFISLKSLKNI